VAEVADLTSIKQKSCRTWPRFPKRPQGSSDPQAQPTLEGRAPDPTNRREIVIDVPRLRLDSRRRRQDRAHLPRRDGATGGPARRSTYLAGRRSREAAPVQGRIERRTLGSISPGSGGAVTPHGRQGRRGQRFESPQLATFRDKPLTPRTIISASSSSDDGVHGSSAVPSPPTLVAAIANVPNTGLRARLTVGTRCSKG
jgi:hypothetical protein